jgi:hypothetical protein
MEYPMPLTTYEFLKRSRSMPSPPPPRETCLRMAQYYCDVSKNEQLMWDWLLCWAAYDDWLELYWGDGA